MVSRKEQLVAQRIESVSLIISMHRVFIVSRGSSFRIPSPAPLLFGQEGAALCHVSPESRGAVDLDSRDHLNSSCITIARKVHADRTYSHFLCDILLATRFRVTQFAPSNEKVNAGPPSLLPPLSRPFRRNPCRVGETRRDTFCPRGRHGNQRPAGELLLSRNDGR